MSAGSTTQRSGGSNEQDPAAVATHAMTRERIARYYAAALATHGPTPRGVDWNSAESQELRFTQLLAVVADGGASVLDFGCGYGALAARLRRDGHRGAYTGYDAAPEMIAAAEADQVSQGLEACRFTSELEGIGSSDYALASGLFNVRLDASLPLWEAYVRDTIDAIARLGTRGFAFNMLTRYADAHRMRADLYYADPGTWLTWCLDRFGRHVVLRHDYPLYEFTILVRSSPVTRG
jgi:SAM-dependent methyltransferase